MTQPPGAAIAVSVVIPARSADATIGAQLDALVGQRLDQPWEVVVVDHGGNGRAIRDRGHRLARLRVVTERRATGPSGVRNAGAAAAAGNLLVFCDADDEVGSGWLAGMVRGLEVHDAVSGPCELAALNSTAVLAAYGADGVVDQELSRIDGWLPFAESGSFGIRRAVFEELDGFDEGFVTAEDRDLCIRLQLAGFRLGFAPGAVVHRRLREGRWDQLVQRYRWGHGEPQLYRRHRRAGMPGAGRAGGLRAWIRLVHDLPDLLAPPRRDRWLQRLAERLGRLGGSVRFRTWYP